MRQHLKTYAALLLAVLLLLSGCAAAGGDASGLPTAKDGSVVTEAQEAEGDTEDVPEGEDPEALYAENEYGFVNISLSDIRTGIPENALGRLARIREKGVLTVATEPYFAPQEFIDPSKTGQESYVGADMELARRIANRMGVGLEIVPMEFADVLSAVSEGSCDLAISGLAYTPGRASSMTLSKGYYYTGEAVSTCLLIRAEDAESIRNTDDLSDKNLIVQAGSLQELLLSENVHRYREYRRVSSVQGVYDALTNGSADAAAVDIDSASLYIGQHPDSGLLLLPGISFRLDEAFQGDRVAAPKDEGMLIAFVNAVIDEVTAEDLYYTWFNDYAARARDLGL